MANFLKINDLVQFDLTKAAVQGLSKDFGDIKDFAGNPTGIGLLVKIAASHSGIITRNNGLYLPEKMKAGTPSFTENYGKPILRHHNEDEDAIGRVVAAKYVDMSQGVIRSYAGMIVKNSAGKEVATINDKLINDFQNGKMSFGMQVDVIRNVFRDSLLQDANFEGMGFAEIIANITDQDAAQKFIDGRYLTGSVGVQTDAAICSACKSNWVEEGPCDHKPGSIIDGKKSFLITGNLKYSEYSVVNKPADIHSRVLELNFNGNKSIIEIANSENQRPYEISLGFPQFETQEDSLMADKNATIQDSAGTETIIVNPPEATITDQTVEESFDAFMTRYLSITDTVVEADEEKLYSLLLVEMKEMGLSDKEIEDAKLSTEKRKGLASSSFCGPGRSFPVPDCAHVTAARRLVGRYKGEGDKSKIMACVDRKARAMGCDKEKKDKVEEVKIEDNQITRILHNLLIACEECDYTPSNEEKPLDETDMKALMGIMHKLVGMVGMDSFKNTLLSENFSNKKALKGVLDIALIDEVTRLEEVIGDLRDKLVENEKTQQALKEEYDNIHKDMTVLNDALVVEKTSVKTVNAKLFCLLTNLKDAAITSVSSDSLSTQQLIDNVEKLEKEVDVQKIVDKLGNGTSREPVGTVDNPVVSLEVNREDNDQTSQEIPSEVLGEWLRLEKFHGRKAADRWLDSWRATKIK